MAKNKDCASVKKTDTFEAFIYVVVIAKPRKPLCNKASRAM